MKEAELSDIAGRCQSPESEILHDTSVRSDVNEEKDPDSQQSQTEAFAIKTLLPRRAAASLLISDTNRLVLETWRPPARAEPALSHHTDPSSPGRGRSAL